MKKLLSGKLGYFIKLSFAVAIIYYLIHSGHLNFKLLQKLWNPFILPIALLLPFFSLFINNFRWWILCKSQKLEGSLSQCLKWTLIGVFFNYAFPSSIGGDVIKGYYLAQSNKNNKWSAVSSVIVDRILGLFSMITITFISLIFNYQLVLRHSDFQKLFYLVLFLFLGIFTFLVMSFSSKIYNHNWIQKILKKCPKKISSLYYVLNKFGQSKRVLFNSIWLSFASQLTVVLFMYVIGNYIVDEKIDFLVYLFAVPLGLMIMSVPLTPAGLGVGQLAFLNLFHLYLGRETQAGQIAITSFQVILFAWGLLGAYFYITGKRINSSVQAELEYG